MVLQREACLEMSRSWASAQPLDKLLPRLIPGEQYKDFKVNAVSCVGLGKRRCILRLLEGKVCLMFTFVIFVVSIPVLGIVHAK